MTNAELIAELRGHIREVPLTLLREAADALEAAEKRIKELSLDCELFQQKCMELDARMKTVTDCHASGEGER